jgi:hypothetical protein
MGVNKQDTVCIVLYIYELFKVATKASSMVRSLKFSKVDLNYYSDGLTSKEDCMGTV